MRKAPPALPGPIVVDEDGWTWLPAPYGPAICVHTKIRAGLALGWSPIMEIGAVLLCLWAGGEPGSQSTDYVAATLSREGLRGLIADLQAIEATMDVG